MTQELSVFDDGLAISGGKFSVSYLLDMKNTNKAGKVTRGHDLTLVKEKSRLNVRKPRPPSVASVVHPFEAVVGSWGICERSSSQQSHGWSPRAK